MKVLKQNAVYLCLVLTMIFNSKTTFSQTKTATEQRSVFYKKPKLVVGIVVDQMRYDYLVRFYDKYTADGFKRLLGDGYIYTNANYDYIPTYTACGHACVYTGTGPAYNGIIGNEWFDRYTKKSMYCVSDSTVKSLGTTSITGKMSPKNLFTSTIGDELKLASNFRSKVIGIALKDRGSILPAGSGANAAYWHDPYSNNFISSTYYMENLPKWVDDFNARKVADSLLSKPWIPLLPIESYTESSADDTPYEGLFYGEKKPVFPHNLPMMKDSDEELIRKVPMGNTLTELFCEKAIQHEKLGKGPETDLLAISFTSTDYVGHMFGINAIELEDTYLRLDQDIAALLKYLDANVGKDEYVVFLSGDHAAVNNPQFSDDHSMKGDFFDSRPITDSLKKYIATIYGPGELILSATANNIFLNRDLITQKKLNLREMQEACVRFVSGFEGVAYAMTASDLQSGSKRTGMAAFLQNGYNMKRSGDVLIQLQPGWINWSSKTGTTHGSAYRYDTHVPLLFFGKNIPRGINHEQVSVNDIAPTICTLLNIEFPSGSTGHPLIGVLK
jgi:predicted AlkP superfamily pyrophosphatase or phosphodiesterase